LKLPSLLNNTGDEKESQIGWVPANVFFSKTIHLPEGVDGDEIASFTELEVEELSPFPLEQLVWGYFADTTQRVVYAFATVKPRVAPILLEKWEDWIHIYPSFLSLIDVRVDVPTIKGLWHDNVVTLVYYDGRSPFPVVMEHALLTSAGERIEADAGGEDAVGTDATAGQLEQALAAYAQLQNAFGIADKHVEAGLLVVSEQSTTNHDVVVLNLQRFTAVDAAPEMLAPLTIAKDSGLWSAELRSSDYVEGRLKVIDFDKKLWKAYKFTALVALLMICMLVGNGVFALLVNAREDRYNAQMTASSAISEKIGYLESLKRFSGEQFRPRLIFEELNKYRPEEIYFKNLEARVEENRVNIQGIAQKVKEVNEYVEILLKTQRFQRESVRTDTGSQGDVKFNMRLSYIPQLTEGAVTSTADSMPTDEDFAAFELDEETPNIIDEF